MTFFKNKPLDINLLLKWVVKFLFIYAAITLFSSLYMGSSKGKQTFETYADDTTNIGPIKVLQPNSVFLLEFQKEMFPTDGYSNIWEYLSIDVYNGQQEYLYSFGDVFWYESGYDEGAWTERKQTFDLKVTFADKGYYYLQLFGEKSAAVPSGKLVVHAKSKRGSSLGLVVLGIFSALGAMLLHSYRKNKFSNL